MASSAAGGVKTLVTGAMPFVGAFGGIASAALPVVAVIGSIVAAVSILGDHCQDGVRRGAVCRLPDAAESNEDQRFPL